MALLVKVFESGNCGKTWWDLAKISINVKAQLPHSNLEQTFAITELKQKNGPS